MCIKHRKQVSTGGLKIAKEIRLEQCLQTLVERRCHVESFSKSALLRTEFITDVTKPPHVFDQRNQISVRKLPKVPTRILYCVEEFLKRFNTSCRSSSSFLLSLIPWIIYYLRFCQTPCDTYLRVSAGVLLSKTLSCFLYVCCHNFLRRTLIIPVPI